MPSESALYADWKKLYPRYQKGFFRRLRWMASGLSLGLYAFLPFIRWDRSANRPTDLVADLATKLPDQAVLFDLPARKFYIFNLTIWPQEIFLLAIVLIFMAIGLFFITALAGRVFCGYLCFQTVWTDLFLFVEKLMEGDRKQRIKLDAGFWTFVKFWKKLSKHFLWVLIGLYTGAIFTAYFVDAPTLFWGFLHGDAPFAAWFTLIFLTLGTYFFAGFAREQVCIYICPYARFQGAMFDEDSLIIAYDEQAGEPRQSRRRDRLAQEQRGEKVGLCIDCKACVTVCPTGIDIRDGQQCECITCAACVDACASVRDRMRMPITLIRYTSMRALAGGKTRLFRPRILAYGGVMVLLLAGIVVHFVFRSSVEMNIIRNRQPMFIQLSDGSIQNNYTARLLNMSPKSQHYVLRVVGLDHASLSVAAVSQKTADGWPLLAVDSGLVVPFSIYLRQSGSVLPQARQSVRFSVTALDVSGGANVYDSIFIRPKP